MPSLTASLQNSLTVASAYDVYPTALAPLSSIWKGTFGTSFLNNLNLTHGSSLRNLIETSKVAPPHISRENAFERALDVAGAIAARSEVLTLVARRD